MLQSKAGHSLSGKPDRYACQVYRENQQQHNLVTYLIFILYEYFSPGYCFSDSGASTKPAPSTLFKFMLCLKFPSLSSFKIKKIIINKNSNNSNNKKEEKQKQNSHHIINMSGSFREKILGKITLLRFTFPRFGRPLHFGTYHTCPPLGTTPLHLIQPKYHRGAREIYSILKRNKQKIKRETFFPKLFSCLAVVLLVLAQLLMMLLKVSSREKRTKVKTITVCFSLVLFPEKIYNYSLKYGGTWSKFLALSQLGCIFQIQVGAIFT